MGKKSVIFWILERSSEPPKAPASVAADFLAVYEAPRTWGFSPAPAVPADSENPPHRKQREDPARHRWSASQWHEVSQFNRSSGEESCSVSLVEITTAVEVLQRRDVMARLTTEENRLARPERRKRCISKGPT